MLGGREARVGGWGTRRDPPPLRVLVVEDNPGDARLIEHAIEKIERRVSVEHAESMALALDRLADRVDVILLDLFLPDAQGPQLVRSIAAAKPHLPIVVLTGSEDATLVRDCLEAGAQDFIRKGWVTPDLIHRIMDHAIWRAHAFELRARLEHSDRLVGLGRVAAGVAHEINNPTAVILGNIEYVTRRVHEALASGDPREHLGVMTEFLELQRDIRSALDRIGNVVQAVAGYATAGSSQTRPVRLHALVAQTCRLLGHDLRHRLRLELALVEVAPIVGDPNRLGQVLTNLILNAADAVDSFGPEDPVVKVGVSALPNAVEITVADNGGGIDDRTLQRVFDPFFTTKPRGKGTGLGLPICREIVRDHGGRLTVDTEQGVGSTFRVELPRGEPDAAVVDAVPRAATRRLRVLIVDDEPTVREALARVLGGQHDVVPVKGAREALDQLERSPDFDVLLVDLVMDGMDGSMLAERIRTEHPPLYDRIVFISGGATRQHLADYTANSGRPVLLKPVSADVLFATIDDVGSPE